MKLLFAVLFVVALYVVVPATIVYVAAHFIIKWW
jgi:hypothetical protein